MRRHTVLAASALVALATAAAAQESVTLRIGGQPGQFNRYQSVMDMFMKGGPMASMVTDTTLPFMRMTTFQTRTLSAVAGDTLTINEVIDSARAESPAMPQMGGMMGAAADMARGTTTTTRMNNRGRVFDIQTQMPNMPNMGAGQGMGAQGGGMGGGRGRGMGGAMNGGGDRPVYLLPEGAVRVGDSWTDSSITPASGTSGPSRVVATFRLERIAQQGSARLAVVSMNGTTSQTSQAGATTTFQMTGEFQLDMANSRLATMTMTLVGNVAMGQMGDVPVRMVMSQTLVP